MNLLILIVVIVLLMAIYCIFETMASPVAGVFANIIGGLFVNLFWIVGCAQQTTEYWHGTGPRWMNYMSRKLQRQSTMIATHALMQKRNINKTISLAFGGGFFAVILNEKKEGEPYWWVQVIILLTISILGVFLSEWYFRRKFTRMDGVEF